MARTIIEENHTLNPTPLYVAYPIFRPFASCLPGAKKEQREPLLNNEQHEHDNKKKKKQKVDEE